MTPAERAHAIVSEFSSDFLICMGVGSEAVVIMSDPDYARDALKKLPVAVQEAIEDVKAEAAREAREEKSTDD